MAIEIDIPDNAYSEQTVTFNRKSYTIKSQYNSRFDTWNISISDAKGNDIILGEKITPNKVLLFRYNKSDIIGGYLYISSNNENRVTRNNYGIGKDHTLTYVTFEEVENGS